MDTFYKHSGRLLATIHILLIPVFIQILCCIPYVFLNDDVGMNTETTVTNIITSPLLIFSS